MNVFFFAPMIDGADERIRMTAEMLASKADVEIFRYIEDFARRLCWPADSPMVAVLVAGDREDLLDVVSVRHLLSEIPVVLVLPDRENWTTDTGYSLRPRFLTYLDSEFAEVEAVLEQHPLIVEAAVIWIPDGYWGESVKAVVVPRPGKTLTEQEVIDYCKSQLAHYKKPKSVDFTDSLPRNAAHKVMKAELLKRYISA